MKLNSSIKLVALLGMLAMAGCDSPSKLDTEGFEKYANSIASNISMSGLVVDAYIKDATVYIDLNENGQLDADEPSAITDSDGYFSYNNLTKKDYCQSGPEKFCLEVSEESGGNLIRSIGGFDTITGQPFEGQMMMKLPDDASTESIKGVAISPITSVAAFMTEDKKQSLLASLNLPADADINKVDPLNFDDPGEDKEKQKDRLQLLTKIQNTVQAISSGVSGGDSEVLPKLNEIAFESVADKIDLFTTDLKREQYLQTDDKDNSIDALLDVTLQKVIEKSDEIELPEAVTNTAKTLVEASETGESDLVSRNTLLNNIVKLDETTESIFEKTDVEDTETAKTILFRTELVGEQVNSNPLASSNVDAAIALAESEALEEVLLEAAAQPDPSDPNTSDEPEKTVDFSLLNNVVATESITTNDAITEIVQAAQVEIVEDEEVNLAPRVISQNWLLNENQTDRIELSAIDPEKQTLTFSIQTAPENGQATLEGKAITYTPNSGYAGADKIVYQVSDGENSVEGTVDIYINGVPNIESASYSVVATKIFATTAIATDPEQDQISYFLASFPTYGEVILDESTGYYQYLAFATSEARTDQFKIKAFDGVSYSNEALISLQIAPNEINTNNAVPVVEDSIIEVTVGNLISQQLVATDVDNDTLIFQMETFPEEGLVSLTSSGMLSYTVSADVAVRDIPFEVRVSDGVDSVVKAMTIRLLEKQGVNQPPVANNQLFSVTDNFTGQVFATDADGDVLSYQLTKAVENGLLNFNEDGSFTYRPNATFDGSDAFEYQVSDGLAQTTAQVTFEVVSGNSAPVAESSLDQFEIEDFVSLTGNLVATDTENDALTYQLVAMPASGTLSVDTTSGEFNYIPDGQFIGDVLFSFKVNDGVFDSNIGQVKISILAENQPPIAGDDALETNEDNILLFSKNDVLANDGDPEGQAIQFIDFLQPVNGSVDLIDDEFEYLPNTNFHGEDSFTYQIRDDKGLTTVGTVRITVTPVNDIPQANDDSGSDFETLEDSALTMTFALITSNDSILVDGELEVLPATFPTKGSLDFVGSEVIYTPFANTNGTDSFTYTLTDKADGETSTATVTINVTPVNDAPTVESDSLVTDEDTAVEVPDVLANDFDIDGDGLSIETPSLVTEQGGTLEFDGNGGLSYTPPSQFHGQDQFDYFVTDGVLTSPATLLITVNSVNEQPVTVADSYSTDEDTPIDIAFSDLMSNDSDPDDDPLSMHAFGAPENGIVEQSGSNWRFTPDANFNGEARFEYFIKDDSDVVSEAATVTITVNSVNDAPQAVTDVINIQEDDLITGFSLVSNDLDVDGDSLSISSLPSTSEQGGAIVNNNDGSFNYTPVAEFSGLDSFDYELTDGVETVTGNVEINISSVNDLPIFTSSGSISVNENLAASTVIYTVTADDPENTAVTYALFGTDATDFSIDSSGDLTILVSPDFEFKSTYVLDVEATDADGAKANQNLTITVINQNDLGNVSIDNSTPQQGDLMTATVQDQDGVIGTVTYTWKRDGIDISGVVGNQYEATQEDVGKAITVTADYTDGLAQSESVVSVATALVAEVNDPPVITFINTLAINENIPAASIVLQVDANDPEGSPLSYALLGADATHFDISATGEITILVSPDFESQDQYSLEVSVSDGAIDSTQSFLVDVQNQNDLGVADLSDYAPSETDTLNVGVSDQDGISGVINYQWKRDGAIISGATSASYTLLHDDAGAAISVEVSYTDDFGQTETFDSSQTSPVVDINQVAVIGNLTASMTEEQTNSSGTLSITDGDGSSEESFIVQTSVTTAYGEFSITASGDWSYVLDNYLAAVDGMAQGDSVIDSIGLQSADGTVATLEITVTGYNDPPVAVDDSFVTDEEVSFTTTGLMLNDFDAEGDLLSISNPPTTTGAGGTLVYNNNGTFDYTPPVDFSGTDSFSYTISDGNLVSSATVLISVNNINDAPSFDSTEITNAYEASFYEYNITVSDPDPETPSITANSVLPSWLTLTDNGNRTAVLSGTPANADIGTVSISLQVSDGTATLYQNFDLTVYNVNTPPTGNVVITGTATEDQVLTADDSTIADADGLGAFNYQWEISFDAGTSWTPISGATTSSFTLTEAEVDGKLRVTVSYTDAHGTAELLTSAETAGVANVNDNPTGSLVVTGTPTENETLTADVDTILDEDGLGTFSYHWEVTFDAGSSWIPISGVTTPTLLLTDNESGGQVRAYVTYTDDHGFAEQVTSPETAAVVNINDAPTGSVSIDNVSPTQGDTLNVSNTLADEDGVGTISYQWFATNDGGTNWTSIASGSALLMTQNEVGQQLRVVASYTDGFGEAESVESAMTAVVGNINDAPTGNVVINGTIEEDQFISADVTSISDLDGLGTFNYQWEYSDDGGTTWNPVSGATSFSVLLGDVTVGKILRVVASYTDGEGTFESLTSPPTISVVNVNDAPLLANQFISFSENIIETDITSATDVENDTLAYSISGGTDSSLATINSTTGRITFNTQPDFESPTDSNTDNTYQFEVTVSDGNGGSDTATIEITILNGNDAPVITSASSFNINENTVTVATVGGTDQDSGDTLTYSLNSGSDISLFFINASTGELRFNSAPDFEAPGDTGADNIYEVEVQVTDGSVATTQAVSVTVNNVVEDPVITSLGTADVNEHVAASSTIYTVTATDPDGNGITSYGISGTDASDFTINSSTGVVTINASPEFNVKSSYSFDVSATSSSGTSNLAVTLTINDIPSAPSLTLDTASSPTLVLLPEKDANKVHAMDPSDGSIEFTATITGAEKIINTKGRRDFAVVLAGTSLTLMDISDGSSVGTHTLTVAPRGGVVSNDGNTLYTINSDKTITEVDISNTGSISHNELTNAATLGCGSQLGYNIDIGLDDSKLYVPCSGDNVVTALKVINTSNGSIHTSITLGDTLHEARVSPDGNYVYVQERKDFAGTQHEGGTGDGTMDLYKVKTSDHTVESVIAVDTTQGHWALGFGDDNNTIYDANSSKLTIVSSLDAAPSIVHKTIPNTGSSEDLAVSSDGKYVALPTYPDNDSTVYIYDVNGDSFATYTYGTDDASYGSAPDVIAFVGSPAEFEADDNPVYLFSNAAATTNDASGNFIGLTLTVTDIATGDVLVVDGEDIPLTVGSGTTVNESWSYTVTISGSTATITLTGAALTDSEFNNFINSIQYHNTSYDPTGIREITITSIQDDNGTANGGVDTGIVDLSVSVAVSHKTIEATLSDYGTSSYSMVKLEADGNTTGDDYSPRIARLNDDGDFVVTWYGYENGGDRSVYVQKFNADGTTTGHSMVSLEAFDHATGTDKLPRITALGNDEFALTMWSHDGTNDAIYVQKFNADVTTTGSSMVKLEGVAGNYNSYPRIDTLNSNGDFVVTWVGVDAGTDYSIYVQRFNADGTVNGSTVMLEADGVTNGDDQDPRIAVLNALGEFVVTWTGYDGVDNSVYAQKFNADGSTTGNTMVKLEADGVTTEDDDQAKVSVLNSAGDFAVVWRGVYSGTDRDIFVQRFNANGTTNGSMERLFARSGSYNDVSPKITALNSNGEFVVAWVAHDGNDWNVEVQKFNTDGSTTGNSRVELEAEGISDGDDQISAIKTLNSIGDFVVNFYGNDGSDNSVYIQKFHSDGTINGSMVKLEASDNTSGNDVSSKMAVLNGEELVVAWQGYDGTDESIYVQKFNAILTTDQPPSSTSDNTVVKSNRLGTAYLVNAEQSVSSVAQIEALADNQWNSIPITSKDTNTNINVVDLAPGAYLLFTADLSGGNLSSEANGYVYVDNNISLEMTSETHNAGVSRIGDKVEVELTFPRNVTVSGTPEIEISIDNVSGSPVAKTATYDSGSGTQTLKFVYDIEQDDLDRDGFEIEKDKLTLAGGDIESSGYTVSLEHPELAADDSNTSFYRVSLLDINNQTYNDGFVIDGTQANGRLGLEVSISNDINDDGFAEFMAAEHGANKVHVYNGKDDFVNTASSFAITGTGDDLELGLALELVGDMDLDGVRDILVGAGTNSGGSANSGYAYLISGDLNSAISTNSLGADEITRYFGGSAGDLAFNTQATAHIGDEDGDGIDDFVVGAYEATNSTNGAGKSYVVNGQQAYASTYTLGGSGTKEFYNDGGGVDDYFGDQVSAIGDIDQDGYADYLLGMSIHDPAGNSDIGRSFLIYGGQKGFDVNNPPADARYYEFEGELGNGDEAAATVSDAGDMNGDGIPDFAIGALLHNTGASSATGRVYVIYGQSDYGGTEELSLSDVGGSIPGFVISHTIADDKMGKEVTAIGDVNADGFDDLLISSDEGDANAQSRAGRSFVVYGKTDMTAVATTDLEQNDHGFEIAGYENNGKSGYATAAGDVNGDGISDIILGAPYTDVGGNADAGKVYVIYGGNAHILNPTYQGDASANTPTNTSGDDVIITGDGNDTITLSSGGKDVVIAGRGNDLVSIMGASQGNDVIYLGSGDDKVQLPGSADPEQVGARIDGGLGIDTLVLSSGASADLTDMNLEYIRSMEVISIGGSDYLQIDSRYVNKYGQAKLWTDANNDQRKEIMIIGDGGNTLKVYEAGWSDSGLTKTVDGETYDIWRHESKRLQMLVDSNIIMDVWTKPVLTVSSTNVDEGDNVTYTVTFSHSVNYDRIVKLDDYSETSITVLANNLSADATVTTDHFPYELQQTVSIEEAESFEGVISKGEISVVVKQNNVTPMITDVSLTSTPSSGDYYGSSEIIEFTVTFDRAVDVLGTPKIPVEIGMVERDANYFTGDGSTQLKFSYMVTDADQDLDGIGVRDSEIDLDGGLIVDAVDDKTEAELSFAEIIDDSGHKVQATVTVLPTVVPLNDTGLHIGGNYPSGNNVDCTGTTISQQDCLIGRDVLVTLPKVGDGHAGFDFTKLAADGKPLPIQTAAYSEGGSEAAGTKWACVKDNHTGLMWETKSNTAAGSHLHSKLDIFAWYSLDNNTNGGSAGADNTADTNCTNYNDGTHPYCNTEAFVNRVNDAGLCGHNDWRLPTIQELQSIVNLAEGNPAVENYYFPNVMSNFYWSATPDPADSSRSMGISVNNGLVGAGDLKSAKQYVRLVRSAN